MDFNREPLRDIAFDQIIKRGTADILEEDEQGMMLRDRRHGLVFLVSDDFETGAGWLRKHEDLGYRIMSIYSPPLAEYCKDRYGMTGEEVCRQFVWTGSKAPDPLAVLAGAGSGKAHGGAISPRCPELMIRPAEDRDIPLISSNYDDWDEWGHLVYEMGHIFAADLAGPVREGPDPSNGSADPVTVGFIGRHMEDSMGLLFVRPEYRGLGIAVKLECFMIGEMLRLGLTPYCHVIVGNEASMNLQRAIGMELWDGRMSWVFRED